MNRFVTAVRPSLSPAKRGMIVLVFLLAGMAGAVSRTAAASGPSVPPRQALPAVGTLRQYVHRHPLDWPFQCELDWWAGIDDSNNLDYAAATYCPLTASARITWLVQVYNSYNDSWDFWDSNGPDTCPIGEEFCYSPADAEDGDYYSTYLYPGEKYRIFVFVVFCGDYCDGGSDVGYFNT